MSDLPKATKRRELIKRFKALGWTGPHSGTGAHPQYMSQGTRVAALPNPHSQSRSNIGEGLLKTILTQAGISHDEWLGRTESGTA